jgi:HlyD family secretion protein
MKKLLPIIIILVALGAGGAWLYANRTEKEPTVNTLQISRGDIIDGVGATGTLQAVTTVTVGTQVSGIVQEMYADFNSIVKKGQVVARLDPSILQTQVETAKANLSNANANLERQRVALADSQSKLTRARELTAKQLTTKVDLENAEVAVKSAEAQLKSTESQIVQARAAVNKAEVDLDHTVITAPIDGIVIKRSVDKGQTVAASMSAPELVIIAADLTQMQVNANIDESEVGRMRPGQLVTFRVDAYPTEIFHGTVKQVRLNPQTVQNVVTYSTVIDVPNQDYKLKPGMTANVTIEVARRENVLRIPNAALRFRPTKDIFDALHQAVPPELERGFGRGGRNGQRNAGGPGAPGAPAAGAPAAGAPAAAPTGPPAAAPAGQPAAGAQGNRPRATADAGAPSGRRPRDGAASGDRTARGGDAAGGQRSADGGQGGGQGRGGGFANMTPEEREKRRQEMMANMTPEQRAQFEERRRQREAAGGGGGRGGFGGGQGVAGGQGPGGGQGAGGGRGGNRQGAAQPGTQTAQNRGQGGQAQGSRRGTLEGQVASRNAAGSKLSTTSATTIDALFAPLQAVETRGRAWLFISKQLKPVELRLGITDGTFTEILNEPGELQPNTEVVTSIITPEMASRPANGQQNNQSNNPLMPQRGRPGGPGGGGGGRGGGR